MTPREIERLAFMLESEPEAREGDLYQQGRYDMAQRAAGLLRDILAYSDLGDFA